MLPPLLPEPAPAAEELPQAALELPAAPLELPAPVKPTIFSRHHLIDVGTASRREALHITIYEMHIKYAKHCQHSVKQRW